MKKLRRICLFFAMMLVFALPFSAAAHAEDAWEEQDTEAAEMDSDSLTQELEDTDAAQGQGPWVYTVTSRENAGTPSNGIDDESEWRYDYVALNEDHTGVFVYNMAAFTIRWTEDDGDFSFTDHKGNQFTGTIDDATLEGVYGKYRYEFEYGEWTLPAYTLSPDDWGSDLVTVTDQADVLTDAQEEAFAQKALDLSDKYDVGVYVVLVDDMDNFTWSKNINTLGEEIWAGYRIGLGYTDNKKKHEDGSLEDWKDAILLTVAFDERKYDLYVTGDYAKWAIPRYGEDKIRDAFVEELKNNRWADGVEAYLNNVETCLKVASKGHAISFRYDSLGRLISIVVPIVLALIFGYGIAALMRSSMQNTQKAKNAAAYVAGDQVNFTRREDRYIRTLVSRVYSPREKSSGGGGGHSSSSSGGSHTSGSF